MAGIAAGMLGVIFIAGRPQPAAKSPVTQAANQELPNADRVKEYQDRLRSLERQVAPVQEPLQVDRPVPQPSRAATPPSTSASDDSVAAERKRRDYESLFAANVVLSRRADSDRPLQGGPASSRSGTRATDAAPSIDDVADAVVRATTRAGAAFSNTMPTTTPPSSASTSTQGEPRNRPADSPKRTATGPITASGRTHRLLEGTSIDTVLTNRLDGSSDALVNCMVTNPVYSHDGEHVVVPAGARILGRAKAVQSLGESRLAVSFHRLLMPDGSSYPLDDFVGANQAGDSGLRDEVDRHYRSTLGISGAVGLISGLSQYLGTLGLSRGNGDRTLVIAGSASDATSQATAQVMSRFPNRLPNVTIREGHRVTVFLTNDLELPAYDSSRRGGTQ